LACYAKGLTGTVAATNDPSPLRFFLENRFPDARNYRRTTATPALFLIPFNDHFRDRLKMLLLSNRKDDIFEELAIHIAFAPRFVNLHEFSRLHAKIRGSTYC
jgi:hypothetical protein